MKSLQLLVLLSLSLGVARSQDSFTCPDEFGYFPHPADCTKYYVCVFGGALLESCTGGLEYSHELQTCDWPRNVGCRPFYNESNLQPQPPRQQLPQQSLDEEVTRLGRRSYAGSVPDYRQELLANSGGLVYGRYRNKRPRGRRRRKRQLYNRNWRLTVRQPNLGYPVPVPPAAEGRPEISQGPTVVGRHKSRLPTTSSGLGSQYRLTTGQRHVHDSLRANIAKAGPVLPPNDSSSSSDSDQYYDQDDYNDYTLQTYAGSLHSPTTTPNSPSVDEYYSTRYASSAYNGSQPSSSRGHHTYKTPDPYYKQESYTIRPLTEVQVSYRPLEERHEQRPAGKTYRITTEPPTRAPPQVTRAPLQYYEPATTRAPVQYYEPATTRAPVQQQLYYEKSYPTTATSSPQQQQPTHIDSDYYVYDDDYDVDTAEYQAAAPTTTRTTTKKPSRGPTQNRPTLKPSNKFLKNHTPATVRDVYQDLPSRPQPVYQQPPPDTPAKKCGSNCLLPDCYCGGKHIPGGYSANQIPQIVMLTFDDSVNDLNKGLYTDLFEKGRRNPNGCGITATFYVSHEWTDYGQVQNLAADGHEMASHSVSHSFGEQFTTRKWDKEITGQREILSAYGGLKLNTIRGMRAPFLAIGGNNMFKMLHQSNWTYDSSMPVYENNPPSWPYTLDYKIFHDCMIPPCPTKSYPGVWEVPMVMWQDLKGGRCSMADACSNPPDAEGVYKMLAKNFERHYNSNRAPFGMYYHAAWFTQQHHKEGFIQFLDALTQMDDVYIITTHQALEWVRDPVPLSQILNFEPWRCDSTRSLDLPPKCKSPKVCNLWHKSGVRYLKTCQPCPEKYPWTGETGVVGGV